MTQAAHITGPLAYREGDGPNITIRPGPCEVDVTPLDATLQLDRRRHARLDGHPAGGLPAPRGEGRDRDGGLNTSSRRCRSAVAPGLPRVFGLTTTAEALRSVSRLDP